MLENIQFESDRLITQPLSEADAKSLFQIYSDNKAMIYRGSRSMHNMEDAYTMVSNQFVTHNQISKLRLGVRVKSTNQLIGTLLLTWSKNSISTCELGFSFGKDYWNNGFGKETVEMVVKKLQTTESITEIIAWCIKENLSSVKLFRKTGFSKKKQNEYPKSYLFSKRIKHKI